MLIISSGTGRFRDRGEFGPEKSGAMPYLGVEVQLEEEGYAVTLLAQLVHDSVHRRSQVIVCPVMSLV